jgi:hypothetical protein
MIKTYLGNKVSSEWMPLPLANGIDDSKSGGRFDNLYRVKKSPFKAFAYWLGWLLGKSGMGI